MASIERHPARAGDPKNRQRWRARWRDPDGKQRSRVFDRKVDAEKHLTHVEHSKHSGAYVDPSAGRVTFREYAEQWRARQLHREGTAVSVEHRLRRHVYPTFGARPIAAVKPSEVQAWVTERSDVLKPSTLGQVYRTVSAIFRDAERDRVIHRSPCDRIQLPRRHRAEASVPSAEQVAAIAAQMPERYRVAIHLAAGAGLRLGEVLGLTVDRVDSDALTIRVDRQMLTGKGGAAFAPPKTASSVRTVPAARVVVDAVEKHLASFPAVDGRVLSNELDGPVRSNVFQTVWRRACRRAGVQGVTFHDLRHFYASALIASGCSVVAVQAALGHANATETLNTYSHLWPSDEDRTRAAIEATLNLPA
jgi:integrase